MFMTTSIKSVVNESNYEKGGFYGCDEYFLSMVVLPFMQGSKRQYCVTMNEYNDILKMLRFANRFYRLSKGFQNDYKIAEKFMKQFLGIYFNKAKPIAHQFTWHNMWMNEMSFYLTQTKYGVQRDMIHNQKTQEKWKFTEGLIERDKGNIIVDDKCVEKYRYLRENLIKSIKIIVGDKDIVEKYKIFINDYVCNTFPGRLEKMGKILWTPTGEMTPFEYFKYVDKDKKITSMYSKSKERCKKTKIGTKEAF